MPNPLVIAYHLIWTGYGHWLPNDPRGSGTKQVNSDLLAELGELHYGRKTMQPAGWQVEEFYQQARPMLRFPVLDFGAKEIEEVAAAFGRVFADRKYTCYACAVMPDHAHLILRKHRDTYEEMLQQLQNASSGLLGLIRFGGEGHPIWTTGGWSVFLDHPDEIWRTIKYIERNPIKEGLEPQSWNFVQPYDGWPLHPGHNPNSPWARRMRR